ncbi:MAG: OB-fold nucleic acid binding domain-containing protein [Gammaproteobacteria bacterium]
MQTIPREEEAVYDMICRADTVGVFQIESRAQMSMLPRLRPRNYYDLVIQIAIVRPGPIEGGMVHPYLRRRNGEEEEVYETEEMKAVLGRTLGVSIFQEQVMQIAIVGAGFTPGRADQLRRAMAAWKKKGGMEPFRDQLIAGFLNKGYTQDFAERIYKQIRGFGEYGFPESHSASFAHLAYISSWFKCHHPAAFCCALLNSQPMGFYLPPQLIQDVRNHGVKVLPVDVNASDWDCTLEFEGADDRPRLRIGFRLVKILSEAGANAIAESRKAGGLFTSVQELVFRSGINKKDLEALAAADALRRLSGDRHRAFWQSSGVDSSGDAADLFNALNGDKGFGVDVMLPVPGEGQNIYNDYDSLGFTLRRHPLALFRQHLDQYCVTPAGSLGTVVNNDIAKVTGIVTARQRPQTASGVTFLTLEDETGFTNVVVWPALGEKRRLILRRARLMGVVGHVQHSDNVTHLIAEELVDLSHWFGNMRLSSRDFT